MAWMRFHDNTQRMNIPLQISDTILFDLLCREHDLNHIPDPD
jgi:hypothetical protein